MRWLVLVCYVLMTSAALADTPQLPVGVTCSDVRAKVAEHGRYIAYAWARLNGFSKEQIAEAKRCLR